MNDAIYEKIWSKFDAERDYDLFYYESISMLVNLKKLAKTTEQKNIIQFEYKLALIISFMYRTYTQLEYSSNDITIIEDKIYELKKNTNSFLYFEDRKKCTNNSQLCCEYYLGCYLLSRNKLDILKVMQYLFTQLAHVISNDNYHDALQLLFFIYNINKKYNLKQEQKIHSIILKFANECKNHPLFLQGLCELMLKMNMIKSNEMMNLSKSLASTLLNNNDLHAYKKAIDIMIIFLNKTSDIKSKNDLQTIIKSLLVRIEKFALGDNQPPILRIEFIKNIIDSYDKIRNNRNKMFINDKISHLNNQTSKITKIMEYTTLENKIPIKKITIPGDTGIGRIENIINFFEHVTIPTIDKIKDQNNENMEKHPLVYMFPTIEFGPNYPKSFSHSDEEIKELNFDRTYIQYIDIAEITLSIAVEDLEKCKKLDQTHYYDYISISEIYDKNDEYDKMTLDIIKNGIKHHCNGKYMESVHLLMPQIENILKQVFKKYGVAILKNDDHYYILEYTLGVLISKSQAIFDKDIVKYLQMKLLKDGKNQRNDICHGIPNLELFSHRSSLSIICIMLFLIRCYNHGDV